MVFFSPKAKDILGMNSRNLEYISRYNSNADKKFADDKIFTKKFLESRGIGVAKLSHVIDSHTQLTDQFFESLPTDFVIKPNRGFGGGGISVIVRKKGKYWFSASDKKFSAEDLFRQCTDILDGKYSISGTTDKVIFEERLIPHEKFNRLTDSGLPDVRVIVFNRVPILAMLRVPTIESEGKANMELGAYAMGIDIGSGKTTGAAYYTEFIRKLHNGESAVGFQVPHWDEILYAVSKIQIVTGIGYLGVDLVITKTGVKVLELNARSGLKIQIANRTPQKPRLRKVADLKVLTPEEGVRIAKTLFSAKNSAEKSTPERPVIGAEHPVILNAESPVHLHARMALSAEENKISRKYFDPDNPLLDITIEGKRLKLPVKPGRIVGADLILAGRFLSDFYLDPGKKFEGVPSVLTAHVDKQIIKNIDAKVCEIDEQIKLLSHINPQNAQEQQDLFLSNTSFSPRFWFREQSQDLVGLRRELKKIPEIDHPLYPIFAKKIQELESKINLIESVGTPEFSDFSTELFGSVDMKLYRKARNFLKKHQAIKPDTSPIVTAKIAAENIEAFLRIHKLSHWNVKMIEQSVADMQVSKNGKILIKKSAKFTENRLQALLVHEVGTHVFRNENGKRQPFGIFQRGTAGYLVTEEGLAVWNQNQLGLDLGEKFLSPALMIVTLYQAQNKGFRELFQWLKDEYQISDQMAWSRCLKAKRGFTDTDQPGAFTKDSVYFRGFLEIESFLKKGGSIEELYAGKITVADLEILQNYDELKPAKYLL